MNALGSMYGKHAVQAEFGFCVTGTREVNGVERTMVGGVVLDGFGSKKWERWRGTIILIPAMIDDTREPCALELRQLMTGPLGRDTTEPIDDLDSFWVPKWREK